MARHESFGGQWSITKLQCVENYLQAYLMVLQNQNWAELWYIDVFSGEGVQYLKVRKHMNEQYEETSDAVTDDECVGQFTLGSSLRAIEVSIKRVKNGGRGFDHFVFIELNNDKLDALRYRINQDYPDYLERCRFVCGDANVELPKILKQIDWSTSRGVSFVDPFATEMTWESLSSFKATCCDFWLLFPLHAIIRMLPTGDMPSKEWSRKLGLVFGNDDWRELYSERKQLSLFQDGPSYERTQGVNKLLEYATACYKKAFPGVWGPAVLRSRTNAPLFALYAIVPNGSGTALGASGRIARHLISQIQS